MSKSLSREVNHIDPTWEATEDELALGFTKKYSEGLRYVALWKRWLKWDGTRWAEDQTIEVFDKIREHCREASAHLLDKSKRINAATARTAAAVERFARADRRHAALPDIWDADPWLLNTPGGIVDLKTGALGKHVRSAYMRKITAANPGSRCRRWRAFLREITDGDAELQAFLQRLAGYWLTGSTREHAFVFFYGTGANGKSVLLNTLRGMLGDYAKVAPMEIFTESQSDRHPTEFATLQGARLVIAQETEEGRRWSENKIKALTGGDSISARYMRQDFFEYLPVFKLVIAGNHKPSLSTVDEAMRRRLILVPFTVTIPPEKRDPDLVEKLRAEWPGILQWAMEGCLSYLDRSLDPPAKVKAATDEYFESQDSFRAWLEDRCEVGPDLWEKPSLLFNSWRAFAEANGTRIGTDKQLADRLDSRDFVKGKTGTRGRHWIGLRERSV